ncbi:hypothetical protein GBF35_16265 [Nonomuraea phyllanthi]|uniref:ATP-binding protein n=1 Tax=Nonomuraea phyllanthi TaxID=2219224 RepID=UPI001293D473|nr:ATP-binding protein [Nonomuraea phyllanthi]QFY08026.1 hypothetical protein GBF35_16265 [Nonomuraea phyllanthi]
MRSEFPNSQPDDVLAELRSTQYEGMWWRRAFAGQGDQAAPARLLVALLLGDTCWGQDAEWVAAELISNALRHTDSGVAGGFFVVEVARTPRKARLVVHDLGGSGTPDFGRAVKLAEQRKPGQYEDGYGLASVARVASRVGVSGDPIGGHAVWAEFDLIASGDEEHQRRGEGDRNREGAAPPDYEPTALRQSALALTACQRP